MQTQITWPENLSIGVPELDAHHEQILRYLEIFRRSFSSGREHEEIVHLLGFLNDYSTEHFFEEEAYLEYINYPFREEHKRLHRAYLKKLTQVINRFEAEGASDGLVAEVSRTLVEWLIIHITVEDQKFADYAHGSARA